MLRERSGEVRAELDLYVDMLGFIDFFEFGVNLGANTNVFIPTLLGTKNSAS